MSAYQRTVVSGACAHLNRGRDSAGLAHDPEQACRTVIAQMTNTARSVGMTAFFRQTCIFSDGHRLFCFRYASDDRCPTLYVSRRFTAGGLVVASEPLCATPKHPSAILTIPLAEYFDPFGETATVHNNLRSAHNTMEQLDCVFLRLTDFARTVLKGEM